jgi:hypothetical protein
MRDVLDSFEIVWQIIGDSDDRFEIIREILYSFPRVVQKIIQIEHYSLFNHQSVHFRIF